MKRVQNGIWSPDDACKALKEGSVVEQTARGAKKRERCVNSRRHHLCARGRSLGQLLGIRLQAFNRVHLRRLACFCHKE